MRSECFFDYTCGYSFRVWRWFEEQVRPARGDLELEWSPFSLKEVNRAEGTSVFEPGDRPSLSVLALALGLATRSGGGDFAAYHSATFRAFHDGDRRLTSDDLLGAVEASGLDPGEAWGDRARWIAEVGASHRRGIARWGVFGTPTLVLEESAVYLKMAEVPRGPADGVRLWDAIETLVVSHPDLVEIKRPVPVPAPSAGEGTTG